MSQEVNPEHFENVAKETLQEWLQGYVELDDNNTTTGKRQVRVTRLRDDVYQVTDPGGYVHYGNFRINVSVEEVTHGLSHITR